MVWGGLIHKLVANSFGVINSFLASGDFCNLLMTFANGLVPDQENVGPDLDPKHFTL